MAVKLVLTYQGVHVCEGGGLSVGLGVCPQVNSVNSPLASICSSLELLSAQSPAGVSDSTVTLRGVIPINPEVTKLQKVVASQPTERERRTGRGLTCCR